MVSNTYEKKLNWWEQLWAGTGMIAFGLADINEGLNDIWNGTTGQLNKKSSNFLRDTIFGGDENLYYNTKLGFMVFGQSAVQTFGPVAPYGFSGNTGVGNSVKIKGRGSTEQTDSYNLEEQMAMHEVKSNPLNNSKNLGPVGDSRWIGWNKYAINIKCIEIHFVHNPVNNLFDDFKFK